MSEFIQMWQGYQIAIDNSDHARQISIDRSQLFKIISVRELEETKRTTMLEF